MKKHLFLVAALAAGMAVHAEVKLTETFDYTAGNAIGTVEGWKTSGDLTDGEGRIVSEKVLTYSNSGGEYILSGEGKSLKHSYKSNKTGSANGQQYMSSRAFDKVTDVVYLSYIYMPDGKQDQSNGELLGLTSGDTNPTARPWTGKVDDATKATHYRFGLTMRSGTSADIVWDTKPQSIEDTVLLVLKFQITKTDTIASLFINPTIGTTEEPAADITDNKGAGRDKIDNIMFRNQGASKSNYYIGGVRVSTTWAEAVAPKASEEVEPGETTGLEEINAEMKARKVIVDGQMLIERNGEFFDMTGAKLQ